MVRYANDLSCMIFIFMNFNENIKNGGKITRTHNYTDSALDVVISSVIQLDKSLDPVGMTKATLFAY